MSRKYFVALAFLILIASCSGSAEGPKKSAEFKAVPVSMKETQERFRFIAKRATPAVVQIYTLKTDDNPKEVSAAGSKKGFFQSIKNIFRSLFVVTYKVKNTGTGFLINKRGYILTNYHVVENADQVLVKIGSEEINATMLGADPVTDIALVKIGGDYRYSTLPLGDSDRLEVGEWVLAIGNPFSLGSSFTAGVVSGLRRDDIGIVELEDFIQTDTSINPGNSGGPLLNINGEVIGINTAIFQGGSGVGLAVPINMAKAILPQLVAGEIVKRGMLGVGIQNITAEVARELNVNSGDGVLVKKITPGSPAQKAGILEGDIIESFDGKKITHYRELKKAVLSRYAGTKVKIGVLRKGEKIILSATLVPLEPSS